MTIDSGKGILFCIAYRPTLMKTNKIKSVFKCTWNFLVGISNIISCITAIISCGIIYLAVLEVMVLNIEIKPVVEKIHEIVNDSTIIIERRVPVVIAPPGNTPNDNKKSEPKHSLQKPPKYDVEPVEPVEPNADSTRNSFLSDERILIIEEWRERFLRMMGLLRQK